MNLANVPAAGLMACPASAKITQKARRTAIVLLCICSAAIAARTAFLVAFLNSSLSGFYFADQMYYRNWALRIAMGDWRPHGVFEQGPMYPYLLSLFYALLGPGDLPVLVFQSLCGIVTVTLLFACANRLFGLKVAAAAGFFAAVYGPSIFYESLVMKTFLEPLLVMAALYCILRYSERVRVGWLVASSAAIGIACLVREIHALLLLVVLGWEWFSACRSGGSWLRRITHLIAGVLVFGMPILPTALSNFLVAGDCVLVTAGGGEVFFMAFGPEAQPYYHPPDFVRPIPHLEHLDFRDEASMRTGTLLSAGDASRYWFRQGMQAAAASPQRVLQLLASRAALIFNDFEVPDSESILVARDLVRPLRALPTFAWFFGLGLLGVVLSLSGSSQTRLPLAFVLVLGFQVLLTYNYGRFRIAFATMWLLFAGRGAVWLLDILIHPPAWRRWQTWSAFALLALSSTVAFAAPPGVPAEWLATDFWGYRQEIDSAAQHRRALPALRQALALQPEDPWILDSLAIELENAGRGYEAVPFYESAVRLDPTLISSHDRLADIYYREGALSAAVSHARVVAMLEPDSTMAHLELAVFCSRQSIANPYSYESEALFQEAEEHFHIALQLDSNNWLAYYYRGRFLGLRGFREEASVELSRASELTQGRVHRSIPW